MERLRQRKASLYPVEIAARQHIDGCISELATGSPELDAKFKRIDLNAALSSRRLQVGVPFGVPRFSAMSIRQPELLLAVEARNWKASPSKAYPGEFGAYSKLCDSMAKTMSRRGLMLEVALRVAWLVPLVALGWLTYYLVSNMRREDFGMFIGAAISAMVGIVSLVHFCGRLGHAYVQNLKYSLSLQMGGALPDDARKAIEDNRTLFEDIYIVAEAPAWKFERRFQLKAPVMPRIEADPLVVGRKNGCFYLVHTFDLTPLEKWLVKEF